MNFRIEATQAYIFTARNVLHETMESFVQENIPFVEPFVMKPILCRTIYDDIYTLWEFRTHNSEIVYLTLKLQIHATHRYFIIDICSVLMRMNLM